MSATPTPLPATAGLISGGRPVEVSSTENDSYPAANAVDGRLNTRWASAYEDNQFITIDLGEARDIARVYLQWEAAYGKAYKVQVSDDNATWTDIAEETNGNGGIDDFLVTARGRYVRLECLTRGTEWGFSLWEFWVFDSPDVPLPTPDVTGDVSAPVDNRADVFIREIGWTTDKPRQDGVTFTAVLANAGNTVVLDDFRVAFRVGGEVVSWADVTEPLMPGVDLPVTADGGPDGVAVWNPAATDSFIVLAWVDEDGTLDELDAHNNMLTRSGRVQPPATVTPIPPTPTLTPTLTAPPTAPAATVTPVSQETPSTASGAGISWLVGIVTALVVFVVVVFVRLRRLRN